MLSLSDRVLLMLPGLFALLLAFMSAVPISVGGVSLTPNFAWLVTIALAALYPAAWSYWFAFLIGLVQDLLYGTPLGAQALLTLLLFAALRLRPPRVSNPLFRVVWAEALILLVLWHGLLWLILAWVGPVAPPLPPLLSSGVVNALWFPVVYFPLLGLSSAFPAR